MKDLLAIGCLLMLLSGHAQDIKKKTINSEFPDYKEVFYVLKDSSEVKHGEYKRTYKGYAIREEGQYDNGKKTGIWKYYDPKGQLEQEIDFANKKIISSKAIRSMRSWIIKGEMLIENTSENLPLILGSQSKLSHFFVKYMRYPADARRMGIDGIVLVSATVTPEGALIDEKLEKGLGYGLDEEAVRVLKLLPDEWLPVGWDGTPEPSRIMLEIKYKLN